MRLERKRKMNEKRRGDDDVSRRIAAREGQPACLIADRVHRVETMTGAGVGNVARRERRAGDIHELKRRASIERNARYREQHEENQCGQSKTAHGRLGAILRDAHEVSIGLVSAGAREPPLRR